MKTAIRVEQVGPTTTALVPMYPRDDDMVIVFHECGECNEDFGHFGLPFREYAELTNEYDDPEGEGFDLCPDCLRQLSPFVGVPFANPYESVDLTLPERNLAGEALTKLCATEAESWSGRALTSDERAASVARMVEIAKLFDKIVVQPEADHESR